MKDTKEGEKTVFKYYIASKLFSPLHGYLSGKHATDDQEEIFS